MTFFGGHDACDVDVSVRHVSGGHRCGDYRKRVSVRNRVGIMQSVPSAIHGKSTWGSAHAQQSKESRNAKTLRLIVVREHSPLQSLRAMRPV